MALEAKEMDENSIENSYKDHQANTTDVLYRLKGRNGNADRVECRFRYFLCGGIDK